MIGNKTPFVSLGILISSKNLESRRCCLSCDDNLFVCIVWMVAWLEIFVDVVIAVNIVGIVAVVDDAVNIDTISTSC